MEDGGLRMGLKRWGESVHVCARHGPEAQALEPRAWDGGQVWGDRRGHRERPEATVQEPRPGWSP